MASREEMDTMEVGESVTEQKLNKREKKKNNEAKPAKRRFLVLRNPDSVPETVPSKVAKYEEGPDNGGEVLDKMAAWSDMNLPAEVLRALSEMDYTSPTPIQKAVIPKALENLDIIGAAETGSGKTLAFVIPLICGILDQDKMDNAMDSSEESGRGSEDEESDDEDLVSEFDSDAEDVVGGAEKTGYDADVDDGDSAAVEESLGEFLEVIDDSGHVEVIKLGEVVHDEDQHEPTSGERKLRAIVVSPTRELAKQIWKEACAVAKHTDITVRLIVGGLSEAKQVRVLRQQGADIVVATPGRLWHLIEDGHPVFRDVSNIKYLVIDETDRMLEQNHFKELNLFLSRINEDETASRERQTFVFSATLTRWASKIDVGRKKKNSKNSVKALMRLVKPNNTRFEVIDLTRTQGTAERLNESRILCTRDEKDAYLYYLLEKNSGRILVFTNTIATSQKLKGVCTWLGLNPHLLHGNMSQKLRQVSLESFSATTNCILIATEVAARGLHIPDIDLIIHYDVPKTTEMYIHRSGRTARAFKSGRSVLLILPEEVEEYRKLCRSLEKEGDLKDYPVESELVPRVKERINLAKQIHDCERQLAKENNDRRWWIKAAKDCDLLQSSDNDSSDDEGFSKKAKRKKKKKMTESVKNLSAHSASLKAKLKNLLSRPLVARRQGESKYPARPGRYPFSLNAAG